MTTRIAPTDFQSRTLAYRHHANICNGGGRGSGKSFCLILDLLAHCAEFGEDARPLVLRESWAGLQELSDKIYSMCLVAFGPRVSRNKAEGTITLPTGGVITLSNISDEESYSKLQGRTFTAMFMDEAGNYSPTVFRFAQRVRSNLRVPPGKRAHIHMTCNPHGRSHALIYKSYVSKAAPFTPFQDDAGMWWIWTQSNLEANPHIDRQAYRRQLAAACAGDDALAQAWIDGDWSVLGGGMFSDVLDPAVHLADPPPNAELDYLCGADFGTASPSTCILLGRLLYGNGRFRAGDIFAVDETDTAMADDLSVGSGASVSSWASQIQALLRRNEVKAAQIVTDDARGLQGDTVVREMQACGLAARRPNAKDRVGTWAFIRSMLQSAADGDDRPALWISPKCRHLFETMSEAPRGTLRADDLDPKWTMDHWCDALGYGVRAIHFERSGSGRTYGMW